MRYALLDPHTKQLRFTDDVREWGRAFEDMDARIVDRMQVSDEALVSTVFLGLDHGFGGTPLWFETMVFGGPLDQETERYTTYEAAETGHRLMVERVRWEV